MSGIHNERKNSKLVVTGQAFDAKALPEEYKARQDIAKMLAVKISEHHDTDAYNIGMIGYTTIEIGENGKGVVKRHLLVAVSGSQRESSEELTEGKASEVQSNIEAIVDAISHDRAWLQLSQHRKWNDHVGEIRLVTTVNLTELGAAHQYGYNTPRQTHKIFKCNDEREAQQFPVDSYVLVKKEGGNKASLFYKDTQGLVKIDMSEGSQFLNSCDLSQDSHQVTLNQIISKYEQAAGFQETFYRCSEPKLAAARQAAMLFSKNFRDMGESHFRVAYEYTRILILNESEQLDVTGQLHLKACCC